MDERFDRKFEELMRHNELLFEGVRQDILALAKRLADFVDRQYAEDRAFISQRFDETQNLLRLQIERTKQLSQRVENLECKFPN